MAKECKNETGVLSNVKNRTKSFAVEGYFQEEKFEDGIDSKTRFQEVNVNDISTRLINKYSQSRIERLAKSIRSTNDRLIHPIILVKPEDLPEDSKLKKKMEQEGIVPDKKYIIVAGERRYRAWMLNRQLEQEKIDKSGFGIKNKFNTITANVLTPEEAKNVDVYYYDSNIIV